MNRVFQVIGLSTWLVSAGLAASCQEVSLSGTLDAKRLWHDLSSLASDDMQGRETGSAGSKLAQTYIADRYRELGLDTFPSAPDYLSPFTWTKRGKHAQGINLLGWIKGTDHPNRYIVVTAHYDHLGSIGARIFNGADDNASGVAGMMAIAGYLRQHPPSHSVILLATDTEEQGLFGAKAFVDNPPVALENIRFNLNLDMIAQRANRSRLYVYGARYHRPFKAIVEQLKGESGVCIRTNRRSAARGFSPLLRIDWRQVSDHGAFHKKGIPFLFVGVNEHKYYHTEEDEVDTIDQKFFTASVETSLKLLLLMDKL